MEKEIKNLNKNENNGLFYNYKNKSVKYIKFIIKNINILIQDKYVIIKKIKLYINCNLLKK